MVNGVLIPLAHKQIRPPVAASLGLSSNTAGGPDISNSQQGAISIQPTNLMHHSPRKQSSKESPDVLTDAAWHANLLRRRPSRSLHWARGLLICRSENRFSSVRFMFSMKARVSGFIVLSNRKIGMKTGLVLRFQRRCKWRGACPRAGIGHPGAALRPITIVAAIVAAEAARNDQRPIAGHFVHHSRTAPSKYSFSNLLRCRSARQ